MFLRADYDLWKHQQIFPKFQSKSSIICAYCNLSSHVPRWSLAMLRLSVKAAQDEQMQKIQGRCHKFICTQICNSFFFTSHNKSQHSNANLVTCNTHQISNRVCAFHYFRMNDKQIGNSQRFSFLCITSIDSLSSSSSLFIILNYLLCLIIPSSFHPFHSVMKNIQLTLLLSNQQELRS